MREIKFRAWDAELKKMLPVNKLHLNIQKIESLDDSWDWYKRQRPIMQYTGLKDGTKWEQLTKEEQNDWQQSGKRPEEWKGREIYEGDIVSGSYFNPLSKSIKSTICFVKWDASGYWTFRGDKDFLGGYLTDLIDCKVIGNIYENPDLVGDYDGD